MAIKPRANMPILERAKQFMPFAALKGLPEALAEKEKIRVPKIEMSEDMAAELDAKFHILECGKKAAIIYYCKDEYLKITGLVARIDMTARVLQVVNTRIPFDDVLDIELPEGNV